MAITPNNPADFDPAMGNYRDLKPFRYWCQKVLPLVYDDSLSYYEVLCKVVDYLNKAMEDIGVLHGDVDALHTAYQQLQSYVNDYFSTLDVQQEINNKLDVMASDGTLDALLLPYFNAYKSEINNVVATQNQNIANQDVEISTQNDKISVLESRMNTFVNLPDGSTSGDAELADIRIGADGVTYSTAGEAVRGQFNKIIADFAPNYNTGILYEVGDYTIHNLKTYKCIHPTTGAWNSNHWIVAESLQELRNIISKIAVIDGLGKNLFNKDTVTNGVYIQYDTGNQFNRADWCASDFIPVNSNANYIFSPQNNNFHICFYDINNNYLSGQLGTSITTPANCYFLRISLPLANIARGLLESGTVPTNYEPYTVNSYIKTSALPDNSEIMDALDSKLDKEYSKNICNAYDEANVRNGYYVAYDNGYMRGNPSFCMIQFKVEPNTKITTNIPNTHTVFTTEANDIHNLVPNKRVNGFISGASGMLTGYDVPYNAEYAIIGIPISAKPRIQVEYGESRTSYEPYIVGIHSNKVIGLKQTNYTKYNIYADGSGDFANLRSCLESITDSNEFNQYVVNIHAGEYDIASLYDAYNVSGLFVPNYVKLKGIGDKHNVILKAELDTQTTTYSLLNFRNVCEIENLTLMSKNCRYTIHDDFQSGNDSYNYRVVKDCILIGESCGMGSVYGSGLKGNANWQFINCYFDATKSAPNGTGGNAISNHNNINVSTPSFIKIENCRLINNSDWYKTLRLLSMTTGSENGTVTVTLIGNKIDGIQLEENNASLYGAGINYWVNGYYNINTLGVTIKNTDEHDYSGNIDLI